MNAGFEKQHVFCSKYRVVGYADVDITTFCTKLSALLFIEKHPSASFYRKRIYNDLYCNGKRCSSTLIYTEP